MAGKKQNINVTIDNEQRSKFKDLFESCPFSLYSRFEEEHFNSTSGVGYARYVITVINRIRKLESDLETETRKFERNAIEAETNSLYEYLEAQDPITIRNAVENWQSIEKDYWINTLGKQAAIELITMGRASPETMSKMVRLPEEMYIKVTQICVRLANTIKETTERAEKEIGIVAKPETTPNGARKINLKKIK